MHAMYKLTTNTMTVASKQSSHSQLTHEKKKIDDRHAVSQFLLFSRLCIVVRFALAALTNFGRGDLKLYMEKVLKSI